MKGVKRPPVDSYEGKTPALGDHQARALLNAPDSETLKGKRDRAILSTLLYHGLRREELCLLKVRDLTARRGVQHLRVHGKGGKTRYLPLHPGTAGLINEYLEALGAEQEGSAPPFRQVVNTLLYVLITGRRWCDLPRRPPWASKSAAHRWLQRWQADGTLAAMQARLLGLAEERGIIQWQYGAVDGSFSPWQRRP
jgi:integrase